VKGAVCEALGYPVPASFSRTQPRFPGQNFDTYAQKSDNLQVWNEDISPRRRYVVLRISDADVVQQVRVLTGDSLSQLDTTGTRTQKFQARIDCGDQQAELISAIDTHLVRAAVNPAAVLRTLSPIASPGAESLLPIATVFTLLRALIGVSFPDTGQDQDRARGERLHRLVCIGLGYSAFADRGQFPDIPHQLLEVKLQTAPTIDLGLVCPNSPSPLGSFKLSGKQVRHCDVRYALFYATRSGTSVTITHFFLTTGEAFFSRFPQFQGNVRNTKLQIPLDPDFFE
jgi:hypothetical protein